MPTTGTKRSLPIPLSWRTLVTSAIILHSLILQPHACSNQAPPRGKFKAAMYEHEVLQARNPEQLVTRGDALKVIQQNLDIYAVQVAEAKRQGSDIIVFPEYGLYGNGLTWDSMRPYLEFIPDPSVVHWVPCEDPTRFQNTEVQQTLSCLARNYSIYLVANMGDYQPCHRLVVPNCNRQVSEGEERMQYNTDVVFDPQGKLVARYHKQNLFFEKQFDTPETPELATFNTPFGCWGLLTGFDILFYQPAIALIEREGITNVAFPTAWRGTLPLLTSIQIQSAFARRMGVNMLATHLHFPDFRSPGSGVYSPKGVAAFCHNSSLTSPSRLIVTQVDILEKPEPEVLPTGNRKLGLNEEEVDESDANAGDGDVESGERVLVLEDTSSWVSGHGPMELISADYEKAFVSQLFHDLYNFVELDQLENSLHVCNKNVCCHLTYSMTHESMKPDLFAFGAFDGLHTFHRTFYLQVCALVRCANQSRQSCGSPTTQSSTLFHSLSMSGQFHTDYVFPEVLLTAQSQQLRLAEAKEWSFHDGMIRNEKGFSYPLLSAALFGRWYAKDSEPLPVSLDPLVVTNAVASVSVGQCLMMLCIVVTVFYHRMAL